MVMNRRSMTEEDKAAFMRMARETKKDIEARRAARSLATGTIMPSEKPQTEPLTTELERKMLEEHPGLTLDELRDMVETYGF